MPTDIVEYICLGYRRRLQSGEMPCGIEAIIAACNKAFGVEACECIQHSDGGCPVSLPDVLETAGNSTEAATGTIANDAPTSQQDISPRNETEQASGALILETESGGDGPVVETSGEAASITTPGEQLLASELGSDGRLLQERGQAITTDLEIKFTTDVEVGNEEGTIKFEAKNKKTVLICLPEFDAVAVTLFCLINTGMTDTERQPQEMRGIIVEELKPSRVGW